VALRESSARFQDEQDPARGGHCLPHDPARRIGHVRARSRQAARGVPAGTRYSARADGVIGPDQCRRTRLILGVVWRPGGPLGLQLVEEVHAPGPLPEDLQLGGMAPALPRCFAPRSPAGGHLVAVRLRRAAGIGRRSDRASWMGPRPGRKQPRPRRSALPGREEPAHTNGARRDTGRRNNGPVRGPSRRAGVPLLAGEDRCRRDGTAQRSI
jgi:hypothetical protein